jgi:hypothetical protein
LYCRDRLLILTVLACGLYPWDMDGEVHDVGRSDVEPALEGSQQSAADMLVWVILQCQDNKELAKVAVSPERKAGGCPYSGVEGNVVCLAWLCKHVIIDYGGYMVRARHMSRVWGKGAVAAPRADRKSRARRGG